MTGVILLVNSDPEGRAILRTYLEHHGFTILDAEDGVLGLSMLARHTPDLIIGDFPLDVPGHSPFTNAARVEMGYVGPFLSLTTRAQPEEMEAARAVSQSVLLKPLRPERVLEEIRKLLGEGA